MPTTAAQFEKFVSNETEKRGKVVKFAGVTPEWGRSSPQIV
jgi:hypothetical protein